MTDFSDMLQGYHRFRATGWNQQRARWDELNEGQSPRVMVIACSDSRVDPAQIFDTGPGQIFVVRNVAALVPPFETAPGHHGVSAALEFAVQVLKVGEIVVMGHGKCGGCKAALSQDLKDAPPGEGGFIHNWIELLDDARDVVVGRYGEQRDRTVERAMEQEAVKVSLANLRTFPCVRSKERKGELKLIGSFFAITDGVLNILDEESGAFSPA
ncbi:carbonic anhydrase [Sphingobium sp. HBC34]|uniref:Carbonic anhydrase n=1 Tax=Sphingobium cyanobacteriorum TaxID=3063954 RepID=A0ABT8ZLA2_9SPHN|nr:carbonic anhydrase [Sphingobium sp. HBC34]MDO7835322.1 carbonic anhydrase [Sphingobium sp. HBC34]